MREALTLAGRAAAAGEVPVGAVAVREGERLTLGRNGMERGHDATLHAEMMCLRRASRVLERWRLDDVTLYVTLEPCPMCAAAMILCRLGRVVYGASDPKKGADGSAYRLLDHPSNNHRVQVTRGVLAEECGRLLSDFFRDLRGSDRG
jgi:tRNA(adenine34) deaminase